jgi:hypothetical protein
MTELAPDEALLKAEQAANAAREKREKRNELAAKFLKVWAPSR